MDKGIRRLVTGMLAIVENGRQEGTAVIKCTSKEVAGKTVLSKFDLAMSQLLRALMRTKDWRHL